MDSVVVIANPSASQFTGGSHRTVMSILSRSGEVEALWPGSAMDATAAARHASQNGVRTVVAMGGDGLVHHVAQGLVAGNAALGIIPAGTTNVVARLLGIPARVSKAARLIANVTESTSIGLARMDLRRGTTQTSHHAVFACGLGLDAEVVVRADADPYRKYRFGSIHYARSALAVGLGEFPSRHPNLTVMAKNLETTATTVLIQFRDVYSYFGKIPLRFTKEQPDPMSVLIMDRLKRRRVPRIGVAAVLGKDLDDVNGMDVWRNVDEVTVDADPPVAAQADGESLGMADGAVVSWVPEALKVISGYSRM